MWRALRAYFIVEIFGVFAQFAHPFRARVNSTANSIWKPLHRKRADKIPQLIRALSIGDGDTTLWGIGFRRIEEADEPKILFIYKINFFIRFCFVSTFPIH